MRDTIFCGNRDHRKMTDPQYQIKTWLKKCLEESGHGSKSRLAKELGVRPDAITRMINIEDDGKEPRLIKAHELAIITRFFGKEPPGTEASGMRFLPIRGLAGAGPDTSVLYSTGDGNFGEIEAPKDAAESTEALEVRGDSMYGLANDGYIIFYEDQEPPSEKHIGNMCVCFLEDERVLVKIPYPGSVRGLFHLESVNAPAMRDIAVRSFAIVTDIKTRYAAQKFARRHPNTPIENVSSSGQRL